MATTLGQNQYGKAETRVVKIVRDGSTHHIKDLSVSVALSGDMADAHHSGSNAHVLPTDTAKNTVYAFAKENGIESAERFGALLARHFVTSQEPIHRARVRVEEYAWDRIAVSGGPPDGGGPPGGAGTRAGEPAPHSFVRRGQETRLTQITFDGERWEVVSGLKDLTVLNSTDSEFRGFVKDRYTTLEETHDRVLATDVSAKWRYGWSGEAGEPLWDESYAQAKRHLLQAFADTYSLSLQQTLFRMGSRVIDRRPEIEEIRLSLPNKHHYAVDLTPFGIENDTPDGAVYLAADRPYGLIEATVLRDGADARIPVDLSTL